MSRAIGSMSFDVDECITKIKGILDKIIDKNMIYFRFLALEDPENVCLRVKNTFYGYNDFILDKVEGHYDKSLWSLIHWMLYQEKIYHLILSKKQLKDCVVLLQEDTAALYLPVIYNDIDYERLAVIDEIMFAGVLFVGQKLLDSGFDVSKEMKKLVYEFDTV